MASDVMNEIKAKIADQFHIKSGDENKTLSELGLDSLDVVEFLISLEDEYGIKFQTEEMKDFQTLEDLLKGIESKF